MAKSNKFKPSKFQDGKPSNTTRGAVKQQAGTYARVVPQGQHKRDKYPKNYLDEGDY